MSDVPSELPRLAPIVGIWQGDGSGEYPTIASFRYTETLEIAVAKKPFLTHTQRTASMADGRPLHAETGYWRLPPSAGVELVLAHPTGIVEVGEGDFEDGVIHLRSTSMQRTGTAKVVESVERWYEPDGDLLRYRLAMGAVGQPHQHHLSGLLHRVG